MDDRSHLVRAAVIWIVLAIVADVLVVFLVDPHMPPGRFTKAASNQTEINNLLALIMTPIGVGVLTFLVYALVFGSAGAPVPSNDRPLTESGLVAMYGRPGQKRVRGSRRRSEPSGL